MKRAALLIGLVALNGLVCCRKKEANANKPNIIFILTDDQGWGDFGFNGNDVIKTPVLDGLVKQGILFDRFFVSAMCAPSRASLLTGKYHPSTGVTWVTGGYEVMNSDETTMAEILNQNGYKTGCFGKWHNGENFPQDPKGQGFSEFFGFYGGNLIEYFNPVLIHNGKKVQPKGYIADIFTDSAISFIRKNKNNPFFCYLPYNTPHSPFQVPDTFFNHYSSLGFAPEVSAVYGMCENIDFNVGRLLTVIKENNLSENTILVFTSDNGPTGPVRYNGNMKGKKGGIDEGSVRVPLIIKWGDNLPKGLINKNICAHIDLLPTLMDMCGISFDNTKLDGISLFPYIKDTNKIYPIRSLYLHSDKLPVVRGSIRTPQYRYTINYEDKRALYDMIADPLQNKDILSENSKLAEVFAADYTKWFNRQFKTETGNRPVPIGYQESDEVILAAHCANFSGKIGFYNKFGWTTDWLYGFTGSADSIWWKIKPVHSMEYEVSVLYTCSSKGIGIPIKVIVANNYVQASIKKEFDPEYDTTSNRVVIPGTQAGLKPWAELKLGRIKINTDAKNLILKIDNIPDNANLQIFSIHLKK